MTYFGFLAIFIGIPLVIMAVLTWRDARSGRQLPASLSQLPGWLLIVAHVIAAVIWTTPWDNYLVATGVWYYDPNLVTGVTLGWVPIEEYTFFVVQTLLTGLWVLWLARNMKPAPAPLPRRPKLNIAAAIVVGILVIAAWILFFSNWAPGTYLGLAVGWLLIPVIPQMLMGADALWHNRRLVLLGLLPPWLYLSAMDSLAITAGTWTIDPNQSLPILLFGVLPIEEFIFFGLTNMLIVFGMVLFLATDNVAVKRWARRVLGHRSYLEERGTV
jgi:lycopene cyclase domain-containing protein